MVNTNNHISEELDKNLDEMEFLKANSDFLRGTIEQSLANPITGSITQDDAKLLKFHGSYMQDDRDLRDERRKQKLEPAYSFMIRVRVPGGGKRLLNSGLLWMISLINMQIIRLN